MKAFSTLFFLLFILNMLWGQNSHLIKSGDDLIHYQTFGKGSPVLIINGGPGMSSQGFIPLAKMLSEKNQTIIYDQRGTGKSTLKILHDSTLTMDAMVEDIETLRQHLKIDKWAVMGHSFGGMLAAYYAKKHPQYIDKMILSSSGGLDLALLTTLDITGKLTQEERDSLSYWSQQIANGDTTYHAAFQRGRFLAPAYLHDKSFVNAIADRLTQNNSTVNSFIWQDLQRISFDCKAAMKTFFQPVLIIQGKEDIIDTEIAEVMHQIFPNSELFFIENCAHYGWLEQPDIYLPKIKEFLVE